MTLAWCLVRICHCFDSCRRDCSEWSKKLIQALIRSVRRQIRDVKLLVVWNFPIFAQALLEESDRSLLHIGERGRSSFAIAALGASFTPLLLSATVFAIRPALATTFACVSFLLPAVVVV